MKTNNFETFLKNNYSLKRIFYVDLLVKLLLTSRLIRISNL